MPFRRVDQGRTHGQKGRLVLLTENEIRDLNDLCRHFRLDLIEVLHERQTGHPGGSLSCCEILTALYFKEMHVRADLPDWADRDRLILSKGHAAPMLYRVLAEKGFFPVEEMHTLRKLNTRLQGHPCALDLPGIDASTGPLGFGLSAGIGMALGLRLNHSPARVYVVLGDGELNEGAVWEAAMSAAKFRLGNLCTVVDWNRVQLDGKSDDIMPVGSLKRKFSAFGWTAIECDGHSIEQLCDAFRRARRIKNRPTVILANTVKGKGVSFMEGKNEWHGKAIDDEAFQTAVRELEGR